MGLPISELCCQEDTPEHHSHKQPSPPALGRMFPNFLSKASIPSWGPPHVDSRSVPDFSSETNATLSSFIFQSAVMDSREPPGEPTVPKGRGTHLGDHQQPGPALLQPPTYPGAFPPDGQCSASPGSLTGRWRSSKNTSLLNSLLVFIACAWHRVQSSDKLNSGLFLRKHRADQVLYQRVGTHGCCSRMEHRPLSPCCPCGRCFAVLCPQALSDGVNLSAAMHIRNYKL